MVWSGRYAAGASPEYDAATEFVLNGTVERCMLHLDDGPLADHLIRCDQWSGCDGFMWRRRHFSSSRGSSFKPAIR
jgi:hypothetical protein